VLNELKLSTFNLLITERASLQFSMPLRLAPLLGVCLLVMNTPADAAADRERRLNLWGGQASITLPEGVRVKRSKQNVNRYVLTAGDTRVEVVVERGQIPRKYRAVNNDKIAKQARARLRRQGYKIESFAVAGKTVRIAFSGTRTVRVDTPRGPARIEVPWNGRLKWLRQTDHRTYQSIISIPEPEKRNPSVKKLLRAAGSLSVPPMRRKPWDRAKDTTASLPLLGERVGSWIPGWRIF
jgi:hypothetical protein